MEDAKARPDSPARRVCLFCEQWASGGIESFLYNVLTHADLTGLEVDIVTAQLGRSVFTKSLEDLGVRFVELSGRRRALAEDHRRFLALLETRRYDVIHLNLFQALSLWYAKAAARAGIPVRIAHSHNTALRRSLTRPLKLVLHRWARTRYSKYITHRWACSSQAAEFLFGPGGDYVFIPNGIDVERFRFDSAARETVRRELGAGEATLVLGNVGRLCYQKNQSFLLDVFARLRQDRPDSLLLLVGQGEDRPALEEKARRLGLEDSVIFYGASDRVWQLLWAMDVFLLPSRFEGLSVAAVEAQAAGLGVLYSDALPPEVSITPHTRPLALSLGAAAWAQELLFPADRPGPNTSRACAADVVRAAGFEVRDVARKLEGLWRQEAGRP